MKLNIDNITIRKYGITERQLTAIRTTADVTGLSEMSLLKAKKIYNIYFDEDTHKYECIAVVIVCMENENIYLWNDEGTYVINYKDIFYDNLNEALAVKNNLNNPTSIWGLKKGGYNTVWNLILQSYDKYGNESDFSVTSFTTKESAIAKYYEWMATDRMMDFNVEEDEENLEYTYTNNRDELCRCVVKESKLFN